ncbi:MAG: stage II sporulation protein M, partial [Cyanobacteria bacterium P01_H01_bin.121]
GLLAAKLVYGLIPLLIIAGVIEGFFSPSPLFPAVLKYLVGVGLFLLLWFYSNRQTSPTD